MRRRIQTDLSHLKPGATVCAGRLSRNVGSTLRELRPTLEEMAEAGEIVFYQKGRRVRPGGLRGPFRVALP